MANNRKINGKTTEQRLREELQRIKQTREAVTVAEFARRARVSYASLTHDYREIADEVRRLRDAGKPLPSPSPVTLPRKRHPDLVEASTLIGQLRQQIVNLASEVSNLQEDRDRWQRRAQRLMVEENHNELLRGIIATLSNDLACETDQRMLLRLIEEAKPQNT